MNMLGALYPLSIVVLSLVVAVVYSVAQEPFVPMQDLKRQTLVRTGKLAGVLVVLIVLVYFLSRI